MAVLTNTMMQGTAAISDEEAYEIEKSIRFNSGDDPYLLRTPGTSGNLRTYTYSFWFKTCVNKTNHQYLFTTSTGGSPSFVRLLASNDGYASQLQVVDDTMGWGRILKPKIRDHSAWRHLCVSVDSTHWSTSVGEGRVKIYLNGELQTSFDGTSNVPSQNAEGIFNKTGEPIYIGGQNTTDNHFDGYIADVHFIDGLALTPAAFGKWDAANCWQPKAFALPQFNDGTNWSNLGGGVESNNYEWERCFTGATNPGDGLPNTGPASGEQITWVPNKDIVADHELLIMLWQSFPNGEIFDDDTLVINGENHGLRARFDGRVHNTAKYFSVPSRKIDSTNGLVIKYKGDNNRFTIDHILVDGVCLQDSITDVETRKNVNDGRTWDSTVADGFNGNPGNNYLTTSSDTITVNFSPGIPYNELRFASSSGAGMDTADMQYSINGGTLTNFKGAGFENTVYASGSNTLTSFAMKNTTATNCRWNYLKVDGHHLINGTVDNSFQLKFNDTESNAALGYDSFSSTDFTESQTATGGPILKTDKSGQTVTSGTNTDPDSSNLKLAIANSATDSSSAGLTVTFVGDTTNSTAQSKFYGSSIKLDGTGDKITTSGSPWSANGDATFECWVYKTTGDHEVLWDTTSQGSLTIMSSGKVELHPVASNYQESDLTVPQNKWTHIAFTQTSSARRIWINGIESTWGSASGSPQTVAWTGSGNGLRIGSGESHGSFGNLSGYVQDIRVYDKVKYTSNFTPPTLNDFTVNNLTHEAPVVPSAYMNSLIWTGNGNASQAQTGLGFSPDMVWAKQRNGSGWHWISDRLRDLTDGSVGGSETEHMLYPNSSNAAAEGTEGFLSFDAAGFTVGEGGGVGQNGNTMVGWAFKAGGAGSANNTGSINATVSANDQGSFSIVKYTGNGTSGATVAHGLGKKPTMIVIKKVNDTGDWVTYHKSTGAGKYNKLNTNAATITSAEHHKSEPTDTVFTIGDSNDVNESGDVFMAYCFADTDGLFATGIYTGNGSGSGGPVQTCGFKPHRIAIGPNSHDGNWGHWDLTRGEDERIAHGSGASNDSGAVHLDMTNTGFKADNSDNDSNGNGRTYIWAAWAGDYNSGPDSIDSLTDSPTNYGTDAGAGGEVRGNYPIWNPLDAEDASTLSQGNLTYINDGNTWNGVRATMAIPAGKWYWEYHQKGADGCSYGIASRETPLNDHVGGTGSTPAHTWGGANWYQNGSGTATGLAAMVDGDVIGVAYDTANGKLHFRRNGQWYGASWATKTAAQVAAGTDPVTSSVQTDVEFFPAHSNYSSGRGCSVNFGQRAFKYTAPSGFKCLCTQNLDDTFSGAELNNPSKYFDVKTWNGTGAAGHNIKGFNFQPDMVWLKRRDAAGGHHVRDAIRGATKSIFPNTDEAEGTDANIMSAFLSDGFTLGNGDNTNNSSGTYVGWAWDAGTAASGANNDGSTNIASGDQWVNATAGFSITKYTGNGGNATVGHGLNAVPDCMLFKSLDASTGWIMSHVGLGRGTGRLRFDANIANSTEYDDTYWNNTASTNTVIHLGSDSYTNTNNNEHIVYCWTPIPGYSSFGSYEASGASGKYLYFGFKPAFVIFKAVDASGSWNIRDNKRDKLNPNEAHLIVEGNAAETTQEDIDFVSNGVVIRSTDGGYNNSNTFLYMAWAEHPFKTARAE